MWEDSAQYGWYHSWAGRSGLYNKADRASSGEQVRKQYSLPHGLHFSYCLQLQVCKQSKPVLFKLLFGYGVHHSNRKQTKADG